VTKFKDSLSSLGFFWPQSKPTNKWPGILTMETFPRARLHRMEARPGDGTAPQGRMTVHGITESNEYITMLEARGTPGGLAFNSRSSTESFVIIANYMLVSREHFDDSPTVRRLSFSSAMAEHVLRLWARPDYKEIRHRRTGKSQYERPILHKQVASYVDLGSRVRVRAFRPTVPNTTIDPTSLWTIDFLEPITPRRALGVLHEFRSFLALICGDLIDLWDVQLHHRTGADRASSELYFADLVKRPTKSDGFPTLPILDIGHDRGLFRRIIAGWLADPPARRIARGAFNAILQDKGSLRFSHLRELVTIIEMLASSDGAAPLSKRQSCELRSALKATLDAFAANEADGERWRETLERRINNINYHDAKIQMKNFISRLPQGLVSVPETFHRNVIDFRNTLVHDFSRIRNEDQNKLAVYVAKLKALYALSDAVALGARMNEIREGSQFLMAAKHMPLDAFTEDSEARSDGQA
jgi:ApeA N-terminal domain 1